MVRSTLTAPHRKTMTKKGASIKFILLRNNNGNGERKYKYSFYYMYIVSIVIIIGITVMFIGVQNLLMKSQTWQATFKLIASRSSASISTWFPAFGDEKLSKIDVTFSEDLGNPQICNEKESILCVEWLDDTRNVPLGFLYVDEILKINKDDDIICHRYNITVPDDKQISSCIPLQGNQLYGGPVIGTQYWPSQKNNKSDSSYVTGMGGNDGIVERYWLISSGTAIFVPPDVPLFLSQNETHLCLASKIQPPYLPDESRNVSLTYYVCSGNNPVLTHRYATRSFIKLPRDVPDEQMFRHPIWSTWARYKRVINTFIVESFADQIRKNGFNNSQLEIDDNWETCYGDAVFYNKTFQDPKLLIDNLKKKGFRVTLWTHPFVNSVCPSHDVAEKNHYLAYDKSGKYTSTSWWDGLGGVINFTNSEAVSWWKGRLQNLSNLYNIDAFKFDAGETSYLPGQPDVGKLNASIRLQPNIFTTDYVKTVSNVSNQKMAEVRVVFNNQDEPIFLRMSDKSSTWSIENGLKALVTSLLAINMVGYSFIIPDMVGGNGYDNFPNKELFIRWLQANTFMPAIQFSYVPWDYDAETVDISKKFTALHYQYSDKILELARKKVSDGTPINLPIWWLDPHDEEALKIDSEFLLGEDLLVAPILDEGARSRDIYLPSGTWKDELHPAITHHGNVWLRNYTVNLDELAFFTKIS